MAQEAWWRFEELRCRLFGHAWVTRYFHDRDVAQRFRTCTRCGSVDEALVRRAFFSAL